MSELPPDDTTDPVEATRKGTPRDKEEVGHAVLMHISPLLEGTPPYLEVTEKLSKHHLTAIPPRYIDHNPGITKLTPAEQIFLRYLIYNLMHSKTSFDTICEWVDHYVATAESTRASSD